MGSSVQEILEYEALAMDRPCELIDASVWEPTDGPVVTVVYYRCAPNKGSVVEGRAPIQFRVTAYTGNRQMFSAIADTRWEAP